MKNTTRNIGYRSPAWGCAEPEDKPEPLDKALKHAIETLRRSGDSIAAVILEHVQDGITVTPELVEDIHRESES